jgi:hypothetical protein
MNQNQPFSIDINSLMTFMFYMMVMVMLMRMMDKALEEPKERSFLIGGAKLPAGYVPVREYRRTTTEKPPKAPPRITEEEELQEKKTTLENTGREMAREAGVEFLRLDEGWQAEYATPIYWFKDVKGNKIRAYDLEELKGKLSLISGEHHSSPSERSFWLGIAGAESKFPLGQLVMTRGVNDLVAENDEFAQFVTESFRRHASGDWGDLSPEDKRENEYALYKRLRLLSAYEKPPLRKIWIITEADRSVTTILFPEEY